MTKPGIGGILRLGFRPPEQGMQRGTPVGPAVINRLCSSEGGGVCLVGQVGHVLAAPAIILVGYVC